MSLILVVEPDTIYAERIAAILVPDGWDVVLTDSREAALRSVATQAPSLLIASGSLPGAKDLLQSFARHAGGPGSVVLVPATLASHISAQDFAADDVLTKPIQEEDLRQQVHNFMETPAHPRASTEDGGQLTSADIFGDLLAEVEAEATQRPGPDPLDGEFERELDRKLEETFSGVLGTAAPSLPTKSATPHVEQSEPFSLADDDPEELDELLDRTLSALEVSPPPLSTATSSTGPESAAVAVQQTESLESVGSTLPEAPEIELPGPEPFAAPASSANATTTWADEADDGQRFGEYRLLQKIATGGMAEVWKARRSGVEGFEKTVAIKKILSHLTGSPDFVSMFVDEAKLAAQLSHNHIIQIYDLGKVEDDYFIAMEYVEGKDLRSLLTQAASTGRRIPPALAVLIASRLAQALDHAHRQRDFEDRPLGLVHRDVSPQNVLISWQGDIKLCDFGIVKAVVKASTTQIGALKGKLQYMSPEQAMGLSVDSRSDLFSLGSVLFEMLTGQKLFSAETEMAVLEAVQECRHQSPRELVPELPVEIEEVVLRALAKDPDQRHDSAGELAIELAATVSSMPGQAKLARYVRSLYPDEPGLPQASELEELPEAHLPAAVELEPAEWVPADSGIVFEPAPELPKAAEDAPPATSEIASSEISEPATRQRLAIGWWIAALLAVAAAVAGFWWWKNQPTRADPGATAAPPATELPATSPGLGSTTPEPADTDPTGTEPALQTDSGALPGVAAEGEIANSNAPQAEPIDLEQRVDEVLQRRADELQKSFEEERRRLEQELDAARQNPATSEGDSAVEPPPSGGGG